MNTKDKLITEIRAVPIAGKTYEEYVEAVADRLVEKDYRKIYDDNAKQCVCYLLGCQEGEKIKQQVAREIIETFRTEIRAEIERNEKLFAEDEDDFYEGRNDAYRTAINCLAELKKKYTEDKK